MKSKTKSLILAASALLLASCSNPSSSDASSLSSVDTAEQEWKAALASLKQNQNYTATSYYTITGEQEASYQKIEQFGGKAILYTSLIDSSKVGYLINGSQGIFDFGLSSEGNVQVGGFYAFNGTQDLSSYFYCAADIADSSLWKKTVTGEGHDYRCNDDDVCIAGAGLGAMSYYIDTYGEDAFQYGSLYADYADGQITLTQTVYYEDEEFGSRIVLSNIGTTSNTKIETYVASPSTIPNKTAWSDAEKATIATYFGGESAIEAPFPSGASYATQLEGDDVFNCVTFVDLGCGDKTESYASQLTDLGWTVDSDNGIATKETQSDSLKQAWKIEFAYHSKAEYISNLVASGYEQEAAEAYAGILYPNGALQIDFSYSEKLIGLTVEAAESWVDTLTEYDYPSSGWTNVTSVDAEDNTAANEFNIFYMYMLGMRYYSVDAKLTYAIASEDDATANGAAFAAALVEAGWKSAGENYTIPDEGEWWYVAADTLHDIHISVSYDDDGDYAGNVTVDYENYNTELFGAQS